MLILNVGEREAWNKVTETFEYVGGKPMAFEHSLWAIAQWEAKWHKPYFSKDKKDPMTVEQFQDYINFMSKDGPVDISLFTDKNFDDLKTYLEAEHTAAKVIDIGDKKSSGQYITSDLLYATMTIAGVDWEAQYWNISRLTMLLRIISEMQSEKKKMSPKEIAQQNSELNRQRREALKTKG